MEDEAKLRLGVDKSTVSESLRSVEQAFVGAGERIKDTFTDIGRHIGSIFATGAVIGAIEHALSRAQALTRQAESLGVSTDFLQDITNVGMAAGLSGEQIEKMLNRFATNLPKGSNFEAEFYKIADAIASIEDPASRVQMAVDLFGKKIGPQFVSTLAKGRAGIEEFAKGFEKLSKGDIAGLEEAKLAIERVENKATILIGRLVMAGQLAGHLFTDITNIGTSNPTHGARDFLNGAIAADKKQGHEGDGSGSFASQALIDYKNHLDEIRLKSKDATAIEKMEILIKRRAFQENEVLRSKTDVERYAHLKKVADVEEEILDLKKQQQDVADKLKKQEEARIEKLNKQGRRVSEAATELNDMQKRPYEFSLEELSKVGYWVGNRSGLGEQTGWHSAPGANAAQRILDLRSRAKEAFEWGNMGLGNRLKNQAESAFDTLAKQNPYLQNPQERAARSLEKQTTIFEEWRTKGVPIFQVEE